MPRPRTCVVIKSLGKKMEKKTAKFNDGYDNVSLSKTVDHKSLLFSYFLFS